MSNFLRQFSLLLTVIIFTASTFAVPAAAKGKPEKPPGKPGGGGKTTTLSTVKNRHWDEAHVRRVLNTFAFGGLATDAQIETWGDMSPTQAVSEILTFNKLNDKLSPSEADDDNGLHCGTLAELQAYWSGDDDRNIMKYADRKHYATLYTNPTTLTRTLNTNNLQRTWTKAISTRGCNPFLHKMALYITNYHASISVHKTRAGLIRDYYDNIMLGLQNGDDFVQLMTIAAKDAALARAYGHQYSYYNNFRGLFFGTDDFAREFHQLLFRIQGETEDAVYHEDTTIEHSAWMLSGMRIDRDVDSYNSTSAGDWYMGPIDFSDHYDNYTNPRYLKNTTNHYQGGQGADSCLEIYHQQICGANAGEKIEALTPIAGAHPESMANVPVTIIDFFADDNLDQNKIDAIRGSWAEANFDLLAFTRTYAASKQFHDASTFKYKTAFDRNLTIQNANTLDNEEVFGRQYYDSPRGRMSDQGAEVFEPAHDVFGGQTGYQAANNRYIFKYAYTTNVDNTAFLYDVSDPYTLAEDGPTLTWTKEWDTVIPVNGDGEYVVAEVAEWLWNHFIGDGGKNFDTIARAQVHALLSSDRDFAYTVDRDNRTAVYSSDQILNDPVVSAVDQSNASQLMDFSSTSANIRVGMAINFITMTPYAFAMEGK